MRCKEHYGYIQTLKYLNRFLRLVIAGTVQQNHRFVAPGRLNLIELFDKGQKINFHDPWVTIGLSQRHIRITKGIKTHDHRDTRAEGKGWDSVCRTILSPFHPPKVWHTEPSLVDVEEGVSVLPHLDELERPLLAKDEILDWVGMIGSLKDFSITHTKLVGHHSPYEVGFDVHAHLVLYAPADALSWIDNLVFL